MSRSIPLAAPKSTIEAFGRVADLADAVGAIRVAGMSAQHTLILSPEISAFLQEAHQALLAAHREIETVLAKAAAK